MRTVIILFYSTDFSGDHFRSAQELRLALDSLCATNLTKPLQRARTLLNVALLYIGALSMPSQS
jgi:hypothetical protein